MGDTGPGGGRVSVLMVAAGAAWESTALGRLSAHPGVVVLKRCVDVNDLLATAAAGQADVAVLSIDAPGLDQAAVEHLSRHRVRLLAVSTLADADSARSRAARIGIPAVLAEQELGGLPAAVVAAASAAANGSPQPSARTWSGATSLMEVPEAIEPGRVVAVWGPAGAPGRTTVALGLAAELARRGRPTTLLDADPYGGAVAQHLGIMDEVSGVLAAARLSGTGELGPRFASVRRTVGPGLDVITGLPRAERWIEVRPGAVEHILQLGREHGDLVVDTGFSLEDDPTADFGSTAPTRNSMTLAAVVEADEVVVVGSADPVGLSRLARGLVELRDLVDGAPVRVVVNRMRGTLGWAEKDVAAMVQGFARINGLHFLPEDRPAADRALVAGRTLVESGDSALARAVAAVADGIVGPTSSPAYRSRLRLRSRRAGTTRRS